MSDASTTPLLRPEHSHALTQGSGIAADVIARRDYRSVTSRAELMRLGFAESQRLVPGLLIPIWSVSGDLVSYQLRPDSPRIRDGKPVKYETPAASRMALDVHPAARPLLGDPAIPLWVTEGVKKGDALVSRGQCAIALLGVWNWRGSNDAGGKTALADWESIALNGRRTLLVFDSDVMLKVAVHQALVRLGAFLQQRGADVWYVYLPQGEHGQKVGVDDFLVASGSVENLLSFAAREPIVPDALSADTENGREAQSSQANQLLALVECVDLFHDPLGEAYAAFPIDEHRETWPIRSAAFKRWLAHAFYRAHGIAPRASALTDALLTLEGRAQFAGDQRPVWVRIAQDDVGCVYLDLGGSVWNAVRVSADGWTIVPDPPVHFRRGAATAALPTPTRGDSLLALRELLNLGGVDDLCRVVGWLVACLKPHGPYPVLAFIAEQGSGKSAAARYLRQIVDPSAVPLRGVPHGERDLVIAARSNHILALDNVSSLPDWLSDGLCRMATGAGWATRQLYTDADETLFAQSRPVLLTGIDDFIANADLLDRTILVTLRRIPDTQRRQEKDLDAWFKSRTSGILGALLDAVAMALQNAHMPPPAALPRMADAVAWVIAAEPALPWPRGAFLQAFLASARVGVDSVLDASPLSAPLISLAQRAEGRWQGTAADLLRLLDGVVDETTRRQRNWPRTPRALSSALRRIAPGLREGRDVDIAFERESLATRRRLITIQLTSGPVERFVRTDHAGTADGWTLAKAVAVDAMDDATGALQRSAESTEATGQLWEEVVS